MSTALTDIFDRSSVRFVNIALLSLLLQRIIELIGHFTEFIVVVG